jgi:hypothetical protein
MSSRTTNPGSLPSPGRSGGRWWRWLRLALPLAAVFAAVSAAGLVVALFWWVNSLSSAPRPQVAAPRPAPEHARVEPVEHRPAHVVPTAVATRRAGHVAVAAAPTSVPTPALPQGQGGGNSDAAKNRAIAEALLRVAKDPEAQRKLNLPP